jgi:hypothetical protein
MPEDLNAYTSFWEALLPQSNRRTGFSLRRARKRDFISYQLVGFQFSYQLGWFKPNATIAFTIVRSDADEIFEHLLQRRDTIEADFGEALRWVQAFPVPGNTHPSPALVTRVACLSLRDLPRVDWPAVQAQMIDAMVRLEQAVAPHVAAWLPE